MAERLAGFVHAYTMYWSVRPFGSAVLIAGKDSDGPFMWMVEPSGLTYNYFGCAIGKGKQPAKVEIEKLKLGELTCREVTSALGSSSGARALFMCVVSSVPVGLGVDRGVGRAGIYILVCIVPACSCRSSKRTLTDFTTCARFHTHVWTGAQRRCAHHLLGAR